MAERSAFPASLADDFELARQAGFALFVATFVEDAGLLGLKTSATTGHPPVADDFERFPSIVADVACANPHLLPFFRDESCLARLRDVRAPAWREMRRWLASQHLAGADAQVGYELGALALGVDLQPILVGGLRHLQLCAGATVAELPNGSGYPTVLLANRHSHFDAGRQARLFVEGEDAEALAAWALVVLTRELRPPPGAVERVTPADRDRMRACAFDVVLAYQLVPWLRDRPEQSVTAGRLLLL